MINSNNNNYYLVTLCPQDISVGIKVSSFPDLVDPFPQDISVGPKGSSFPDLVIINN